ncbi:RHS repeat-associated core domain-containing protein, partial [Epilithonimonas hungarica]
NDYYPFGMNMQGVDSSFDTMGSFLNHKYNRKELQETGFYDYGWRQYMPDLGRWFGMDQLSERYNSFSPYAYVMNNPAMMYDPDGRVSYSWIAGLYNNAKPGGSTTYSDFDSDGNWGSSTFSPMGSGEVTNFYNFLAVGGTGNYTYFTGPASTSSTYNSSQGAYNATMDLGIGHNITIKDNSQNESGNWLDVAGTVNDYRDNIGGALADNAGLTRFGTNGRLYFPTANGRVFYGNQYARTFSLAKWGGIASKGALGVNATIGLIKTGQGYQADGGKFGYNAQRAAVGATVGVLGGWGGAEAGALMGAEFGATVGSLFPGAGTVIGGVIGGVAGGIIGAFGGGMWGQAVGEGSVDAYYLH